MHYHAHQIPQSCVWPYLQKVWGTSELDCTLCTKRGRPRLYLANTPNWPLLNGFRGSWEDSEHRSQGPDKVWKYPLSHSLTPQAMMRKMSLRSQ